MKIQFSGKYLALAMLSLVMLPYIAAAADDDSKSMPADQVERAKAMIFEGQPDRALEFFRELTEQFPNDPDAHFYR